jgi:hypothetical protein
MWMRKKFLASRAKIDDEGELNVGIVKESFVIMGFVWGVW